MYVNLMVRTFAVTIIYRYDNLLIRQFNVRQCYRTSIYRRDVCSYTVLYVPRYDQLTFHSKIVRRILHSVRRTPYSVHCTVYIKYRVPYNVNRGWYTVHCTL